MSEMNLFERPCPICQCEDTSAGRVKCVREFVGPEVKKCNACGFVFLSPVMTNEEYNKFYGDDEQKQFVQNIVKDNYVAKVSENDKRRAMLIKKHITNCGKILDVGTGRSTFVGLVENAVGIDISEERIKEAKENNLPVMLCSIDEWSEKVDTITLFHTLEHILNPWEFLYRVRNILSDGGNLVIEVPNINDILTKLEVYEKFYYQNAHCSYFSPHTLKTLVNGSGFTVSKEMKVQRYSIGNHLYWLTNRKPGKFNTPEVIGRMYNSVLKMLDLHDTIFFICKKR